ncbi:MAG: hypothetical protein BV459_07815 [Thermoplasmata archaeon M11B2D]|nr:MAG: hypothetical protein BV459_07815 [Thermoplasmata archaeon M11B2D]
MKKFSEVSKELNEKRAHADMNPKESVVKYLLDNLNNNNVYIHFSNIEKVGINPNTKWATPIGVYGWQLNYYKKKLIQNVEDVKNIAVDFFKEYKLTPNSTQAEVEAKGIDWKNFVSAVGMLNGTSGVKLARVFPFMTEAKYMHVIEAKSGLKWLRIGDSRTSDKEVMDGVKILEMFILKESDKTVENMTGHKLDGSSNYMRLFRESDFPALKKWFGLSEEKIKTTLERLQNNPNPAEMKPWLARAIITDVMALHTTKDGNAKFLFQLVNDISMNLVKSRLQAGIMKTTIYRAMGYDAIRDDGTGTFYSMNEPAQVVFLHPNAYTVRKTLNNDSVEREKRKALFGFDSQTKADSFKKAKFESSW